MTSNSSRSNAASIMTAGGVPRAGGPSMVLPKIMLAGPRKRIKQCRRRGCSTWYVFVNKNGNLRNKGICFWPTLIMNDPTWYVLVKKNGNLSNRGICFWPTLIMNDPTWYVLVNKNGNLSNREICFWPTLIMNDLTRDVFVNKNLSIEIKEL